MRPKYIRILSGLAHDIDFSSLKHALLHATISEFVSPNFCFSPKNWSRTRAIFL